MPAKWEDIKVKKRVCVECGETFTPYHYRQQTCSDNCANNHYLHKNKKPSRTIGSFLNETSFDKAWEVAKKDLEEMHGENTKVHSWVPPTKVKKDKGETSLDNYKRFLKRLEKIH